MGEIFDAIVLLKSIINKIKMSAVQKNQNLILVESLQHEVPFLKQFSV